MSGEFGANLHQMMREWTIAAGLNCQVFDRRERIDLGVSIHGVAPQSGEILQVPDYL